MNEPTCSQRDAASVIFNLPDYHVIDAIDLPLGGRRVIVQADTIGDGCPDCGVVSERVHAWCRQRVRVVPHAGRVEVIVRKPRLVCCERACSRMTFTQTTAELPLRARCTTRLRRAILEAVIDHGRPVAGVDTTRRKSSRAGPVRSSECPGSTNRTASSCRSAPEGTATGATSTQVPLLTVGNGVHTGHS